MIYFCELATIVPRDKEYYRIAGYPVDDPKWWERNGPAILSGEEESKRNTVSFIQKLQEVGGYFFFITNHLQHHRMEKLITDFDLTSALVWKSKGPARNSNHPGTDPRLICWLFYFPEKEVQ